MERPSRILLRLTTQATNRPSQIVPSLRLVPPPKQLGREYGWPRKKLFQHFPAFAPEQKGRHPRVLLSDLALIFVESSRRRAQYRKVDVHEHDLVCPDRDRSMTRGQNEIVHSLYRLRRDTCLPHDVRCQFRAP